MLSDKQLDSLPTFPLMDAPAFDAENWRLRVDGLIEKPVELRAEEIASLPGTKLRDDFTCLEGWSVRGLVWEGVRVSELLALCGVKPSARCALFSATGYTLGVSLARCLAPTTILAYNVNGALLALEHGAPLRLVLRGQECFESVKWVQRIHLTDKPTAGSARKIALKRIRRSG